MLPIFLTVTAVFAAGNAGGMPDFETWAKQQGFEDVVDRAKASGMKLPSVDDLSGNGISGMMKVIDEHFETLAKQTGKSKDQVKLEMHNMMNMIDNSLPAKDNTGLRSGFPGGFPGQIGPGGFPSPPGNLEAALKGFGNLPGLGGDLRKGSGMPAGMPSLEEAMKGLGAGIPSFDNIDFGKLGGLDLSKGLPSFEEFLSGMGVDPTSDLGKNAIKGMDNLPNLLKSMGSGDKMAESLQDGMSNLKAMDKKLRKMAAKAGIDFDKVPSLESPKSERAVTSSETVAAAVSADGHSTTM